MQLGVIGLGRMGANIARQLVERGVRTVVWNRSPEPRKTLAKEGAVAAETPEALMGMLLPPRVVLLFVPAGKAVDEMIAALQPYLCRDDVVIDGGNSFFRDSVHREKTLRASGVHFLDMGTSGGLSGARHGACLTVGGDESVFAKCEWVFRAIAQPRGYAYVGPAGAGHYVKMVHNGVEYALLQSYGEGFQILSEGPYKNLDLELIADTWSHGSIIRSYLLELAAQGLRTDPRLSTIVGAIGGGETGRWTIKEAKRAGTPAPMLERAIAAREESMARSTFATKIVAMLRNLFGGHVPERTRGSTEEFDCS